MTGSSKVVLIQRIELESGKAKITARIMHGTHALPETVELPAEQGARLEKGRPYLLGPEKQELIPLFPLAAAEERDGGWRFGWLAGTASGTLVKYTDVDGNTFKVKLDDQTYQSLFHADPEPVPETERQDVEQQPIPATKRQDVDTSPDPQPPGTPWKIIIGAGILVVVALVITLALVRSLSPEDREVVDAGVAPVAREADMLTPSPMPAEPVEAEVVIPEGMVLIKGATFTLGSTGPEQAEARAWCHQLADASRCPEHLFNREGPVRREKVASFFIDRTEVTNSEFSRWINGLAGVRYQKVQEGDHVERYAIDAQGRRLAAAPDREDPRSPQLYFDPAAQHMTLREGFERHPAARVTWVGADGFCRARGARLPTAAEWEAAARGTSGRPFPWGLDHPDCSTAAFARRQGGRCAAPGLGTVAVGTPSSDVTPEGVLGLGGNVTEWVEDYWIPSNADAPDTCVPPGARPSAASKAVVCRVHRGGDASRDAERTRAAAWSYLPEEMERKNIGFRCAR